MSFIFGMAPRLADPHLNVCPEYVLTVYTPKLVSVSMGSTCRSIPGVTNISPQGPELVTLELHLLMPKVLFKAIHAHIRTPYGRLLPRKVLPGQLLTLSCTPCNLIRQLNIPWAKKKNKKQIQQQTLTCFSCQDDRWRKVRRTGKA